MVFRNNYNRDEDTDTEELINVSEDDNEEKEEEESGDEYIVEKVIDHRTIKGVTKYYLKWKGYPEEDNTWENESDIFAKELIEKYWKGKKENSKSISISEKIKKKQTIITNNQVNIRKRKFSDSFIEEPDFSLLENFPPSNLTNWEEAVDDVETVERNPEDSGLLIYLNWKNGHRTRHPASIANLMCPQKIIRFYEEHLRFKDSEE